MYKASPFLCAALVSALSVSASHLAPAQVSVDVNSTKDNTLYESASGSVSNGAGQAFFVGRTGQLTGSIRRGLVAFALVERIPPGATVLSVTLTLHMSRTNISAPPSTVELRRALANWGEGTSNANGNEGSGAAATTNDATWIHRFFNTATWATPGGDFETQPSASQTVDGVGFYTWGSTSQLVSDVQSWIDNPDSNFGWVVIGDEGSASTSKRFDTKESIDPSVRPRLTVMYQTMVASEDRESRTPVTFALHPNYPNPFNPTTVISFQLPEASDVKLVVYDMLGREVAMLVNEKKAPGEYTVGFDASGFASGMYLYTLTAGSSVQTRKMILAR